METGKLSKPRLVYGVGINDADYVTQKWWRDSPLYPLKEDEKAVYRVVESWLTV